MKLCCFKIPPLQRCVISIEETENDSIFNHENFVFLVSDAISTAPGLCRAEFFLNRGGEGRVSEEILLSETGKVLSSYLAPFHVGIACLGY